MKDELRRRRVALKEYIDTLTRLRAIRDALPLGLAKDIASDALDKATVLVVTDEACIPRPDEVAGLTDVPLPFDRMLLISKGVDSIAVIYFDIDMATMKGKMLSTLLNPKTYAILPRPTSRGLEFNAGELEVSDLMDTPLPAIVSKTMGKAMQDRLVANVRDVAFATRANGKAYKHKVDRLYYLGKPTNLYGKLHGKTAQDIVWVHSWACMGHWRRLPKDSKSIGKDKAGSRVVSGYTWVKACVKGDLTKELSNSVRVIRSKHESLE